MNLVFHDARNEVPQTNLNPLTQKTYLVRMNEGYYLLLGYCDGWNRSPDFDGNISDDSEIPNKHVRSWAELPKDIPCEDCIEDCPVKEDE